MLMNEYVSFDRHLCCLQYTNSLHRFPRAVSTTVTAGMVGNKHAHKYVHTYIYIHTVPSKSKVHFYFAPFLLSEAVEPNQT